MPRARHETAHEPIPPRGRSTRRRQLLALAGWPWLGSAGAAPAPLRIDAALAAQVLPAGGHRSRIAFGDSLVILARAGVIDGDKLRRIYVQAGGLPQELDLVLEHPWRAPIRLNVRNSRLYVDLLWPIGLANHMTSNSASPLNGPDRFTFASTGGWTLGRSPNGGTYFNRVRVVALTPAQEALVTRIAQGTFRPCCGNSTFFQDCNHGSALLGLLALGAAQGLGEDDLYREALAFNAFWFPQQYLLLALHFKTSRGIDWPQIDPRVALGAAYSSGPGFQANVARPLRARGLLPAGGGADCGA